MKGGVFRIQDELESLKEEGARIWYESESQQRGRV